MDHTEAIIEQMSYEGVFPPIIKKLLPRYWRFLAHVFEICISGRRVGADEISLLSTGAIATLSMGLEFNFSKYILNEMIRNVEGKKRDNFLMYQIFLQLIINNKHLKIQKRGETLHMKSLGSSTFGLMKQNLKGKFIFQGKYMLVKFGKFAEVSDSSATESSSFHMETEDDVITTTEDEEQHVPLNTIVAEEHNQMKNVEVQSDYNEGDDADDDDEKGDMGLGGDMFDFNDDTFSDFEKRNDDYCPRFEELNSFFDNFDDVAQPATETWRVEDVQKATPPTDEQMAGATVTMNVTSRIHPFPVVTKTSMPSTSDPIMAQTSQPPLKRRRRDPSSGVLIWKQALPTHPATTTTAVTPSIRTQEGPSTIFETGSS